MTESNGNDNKIDLFKDFDSEAKVTYKANTSTPPRVTIPVRTREEYESYIIDQRYETHVNAAGEMKVIIVDILAPEINPNELLKPAYAYSGMQ